MMDKEQTIAVLQMLMDGVDPITGAILPEEHVCLEPDVLRALRVALSAVETSNVTEIVYRSPMVNRNGRLNAGRAWTEEDNEQLMALWQANTPIEEICELMQRRKRGVINQLAYMGLVKKKAQKGTDTKPILPGRERAGASWTSNEDEQLRHMFQQEVGITHMAKQLQRTNRAIECRLERLGLIESESNVAESKVALWDKKELKKRYLAGTSIAELAILCRCTGEEVRVELEKMGLVGKPKWELH